jgi:hypothetical protein
VDDKLKDEKLSPDYIVVEPGGYQFTWLNREKCYGYTENPNFHFNNNFMK